MSRPIAAARFQGGLFALIDRMRRAGLHHVLDLPQLAVCGDQSSGKSSVLGAITHLNFPTKDTVCTTFATELCMRQTEASETSCTIQIIPAAGRDENERRRLQSWKPTSDNLERFGEIIAEAGVAMNPGTGVTRFSEDVLRIELSGDSLCNLDLVDLPGLFHSAGQGQTTSDVSKVKEMVVRYMKKQRTVVLAIVSAKDDLAAQVVTNLVNECHASARTLAIVTKPDMLDEEPNKQQEYLEAMKNSTPELTFGLGWHVLRNKKYTEQGRTWDQRDQAEASFLGQGKWAAVSAGHKGIQSLLRRLQREQEKFILAAGGALSAEVLAAAQACEDELKSIQPVGVADADLITMSQKFTELVRKAVHGRYASSFFRGDGEEESSRRLNEVVEQLLVEFADNLRTNGHTWEILEDSDAQSQPHRPAAVTRNDFIAKLSEKFVVAGTMPGQFDADVLRELFYEQAQAWPQLITTMVAELTQAARRCLLAITAHVSHGIVDHERIFQIAIEPSLAANCTRFQAYIDEKMSPFVSRREITLDNRVKNRVIPRAFKDEWCRVVAQRAPDLINTVLNGTNSARSHQPGVKRHDDVTDKVVELLSKDVSIDRFSGAAMLDSLQYYYRVQLEKTIGYFDLESVNDQFLSNLTLIFTPRAVGPLANELSSCATANVAAVARQNQLSQQLQELREISATLVSLQDTFDQAASNKRRLSQGQSQDVTEAHPDKRRR